MISKRVSVTFTNVPGKIFGTPPPAAGDWQVQNGVQGSQYHHKAQTSQAIGSKGGCDRTKLVILN